MKRSNPLEFLAKAEKDSKLNARILAAVERGGKVTADEILQIAREFGFLMTQKEFEKEVRRDMARRFAAGDASLIDMFEPSAGKKKPPKPIPLPPESSCAKGCLSYTKTWHPDPEPPEPTS